MYDNYYIQFNNIQHTNIPYIIKNQRRKMNDDHDDDDIREWEFENEK